MGKGCLLRVVETGSTKALPLGPSLQRPSCPRVPRGADFLTPAGSAQLGSELGSSRPNSGLGAPLTLIFVPSLSRSRSGRSSTCRERRVAVGLRPPHRPGRPTPRRGAAWSSGAARLPPAGRGWQNPISTSAGRHPPASWRSRSGSAEALSDAEVAVGRVPQGMVFGQGSFLSLSEGWHCNAVWIFCLYGALYGFHSNL